MRLHRLLLPLLLTLMLVAGCTNSDQFEPGLLRVGVAQMPITLDPRFATDAASARVQEFIHRGLVRLDSSFDVEADLAESWEHTETLLWRFRIRRGISFSDGSEVTANDVAATLKAILDPAFASPLRSSLEAIERIEVEDNDRLSIHLSRPDASLLSRLNLGILPASIATQPHKSRNSVGCGPYSIEAWKENTLTLKRRDEVGRVARIRFTSVKDPVTRVLKLTRGEIDFVQNDLPPHLLPYIKAQKQLTMTTRPSTTFSYLGLNLQDPLLSDLRVRRALALSLDRNSLKRALFSDLPELAASILTPAHWASAELPQTVFDPEQAERLLDAAGFPRDAGGIRFSLNYRTSTDPTRLRLATAIASMWERIGVRVSIESLEWGGFYARIKRGDFQLFSLSWVAISDPDIYRQILHSQMWPPKGANRGRYANSEVDRLLDLAVSIEDQVERKRYYVQVQQQMQADMVYIPLWHEPVIAVFGPHIKGFSPLSDGSLRGLMQVALEE